MLPIYWILLVLFIIVALFMILLVLIQKGRGGGLSSAFGGVGGNTAFGSKTGDVLTWATSIVFGIFIVLAMILGFMADKINTEKNPLSAANRTSTTDTKADDTTPALPTTLPSVTIPAPAPTEPTTKP